MWRGACCGLVGLGALIGLACGNDGDNAPAAKRPGDVDIAALSPGMRKPASAATRTDPKTGLFVARGFNLIAQHCLACHSSRLIAQNRATRSGWAEMLRWMQANHNLWSLDDATRNGILDYLATNYGVTEPRVRPRRKPLPKHLMPPTPQQLAAEANKASKP